MRCGATQEAIWPVLLPATGPAESASAPRPSRPTHDQIGDDDVTSGLHPCLLPHVKSSGNGDSLPHVRNLRLTVQWLKARLTARGGGRGLGQGEAFELGAEPGDLALELAGTEGVAGPGEGGLAGPG